MLQTLLVFSPALGALVAGLFGRFIGDRNAQYVTCGLMGVTAVCAWINLFANVGEPAFKVELLQWIAIGSFSVDWALRVDALSTVMMFVVGFISFLIHVYSVGYMSHDPSIPRFMAYLSLFTFAMLMLVTSDNLLQLFFGWEGVGVASYLLIGFWYTKPSACAAAIKAFIVNRVGDFGLVLGLSATFLAFDSIQYDEIFTRAPEIAGTTMHAFGGTFQTLNLIGVLLFIGAMGKSAQLGLHTWLPYAMEGPTPVSALIHAATMVTAGVFLVARFSPLFEYAPAALAMVTVIGASTAIFAATVGLTQFDIKRVIAYSTCSQLGYMFVALGLGFYSAAIFHLFTHAFFKALLFLGSGSVIHAVSDEQDMRKMGGLRKLIPTTYWMMVIGTLALTGVGIPMTILGTAGFFSKDAIIEGAFVGHNAVAPIAFVLLVVAAMFTSFYSWRLIFMTFHGKPRASADVMHHVHESPMVMLVPLFILAVGALFAGVIFHDYFIGEEYDHFWKAALFLLPDNHILHDFHGVPLWVKLAPFVAMLLGLLGAWQFYIRSPETPKELAAQHRGLYAFLLNKWYFDELYDFLFVQPAKRLGRFLWKRGDGWLIDGFGPDGISARVQDVTARVVKVQSGYLYHYAFAMLIGVAALVTWMMLRSSI